MNDKITQENIRQRAASAGVVIDEQCMEVVTGMMNVALGALASVPDADLRNIEPTVPSVVPRAPIVPTVTGKQGG